MPKAKRFENDITLSDFANAALPVGCNRMSKHVNAVSAKTLRESKDWWEIDVKDFDPLADLPENETEDSKEHQTEDGCQQQQQQFAYSKARSTFFAPTTDVENVYNYYSMDFLFQLSAYIRPEDVGRFALMCRKAYFVTRSISFWRRLYKRYYKFSTDLPERLRPVDMERLYGLRTCVVKSLFYMYQPFADRTKHPIGVSLCGESIRKLCRSVCESVWHEKVESRSPRGYQYFFKFSLVSSKREIFTASSTSSSTLTAISEKPKSKFALPRRLQMLENIYANLEDDCCILKVYCTRFTNVPSILGWRLSEVSISLNSDMRSHRVKLTFESGNVLKVGGSKVGQRNASVGPKEVAVLDGVYSLVLLDWWQPSYPLSVV